jgi:hypothetical protein
MNVEIGAEAAQFPEKEYINGIAVAVWVDLIGTLVCAHLICVPLIPMSVLMPNLALVETKQITGKLYFLKMENCL